jgi:hypothetical protein
LRRYEPSIIAATQELLGAWFRGASWRAWFVFLKALFALPMREEELAIYQEHTGRSEAPSQPAREAWVIVGRRGGKSLIAALTVVYLSCFRDYRNYLAPGEVATVAMIASDRRQARVVHRYIKGFLESVPMLRAMIARQTAESIELSNKVVIEIHSASFRAVRGYSLAATVCDEIAFWRSEESANPDAEIINGLRPGMATIPGSVLLCISSPYARRGALWETYHRHFGMENDPVLVWQAPTQAMNPSVPEHVITQALEEDEPAARAEWFAEFRRDIEQFVSREVLDAVVVPGREQLPPKRGVWYWGFVDPSGGSSDSMTMAIAHEGQEGGVILDVLMERRPPFSPAEVVEEFAAVLAGYGIAQVAGDCYAGVWPREAFAKAGIHYEPSASPKSDLYREFLPKLNTGRVELLDNPRLIRQLLGLERRTARSGKESIDHAPGGHDDLANAVAGAVVAVEAQEGRVAVWYGGRRVV